MQYKIRFIEINSEDIPVNSTIIQVRPEMSMLIKAMELMSSIIPAQDLMLNNDFLNLHDSYINHIKEIARAATDIEVTNNYEIITPEEENILFDFNIFI